MPRNPSFSTSDREWTFVSPMERRLKIISDNISLSRPYGGLAFLSACETAMGDEGLSDEAIHIAVGMLFAGLRKASSVRCGRSAASFAPDVARDVYAQLFTRPDCREAARRCWASSRERRCVVRDSTSSMQVFDRSGGGVCVFHRQCTVLCHLEHALSLMYSTATSHMRQSLHSLARTLPELRRQGARNGRGGR